MIENTTQVSMSVETEELTHQASETMATESLREAAPERLPGVSGANGRAGDRKETDI